MGVHLLLRVPFGCDHADGCWQRVLCAKKYIG